MTQSLLLLVLVGFFAFPSQAQELEEVIMTVKGAISPEEMGLSLIHEHILVDFIGADKFEDLRWDQGEVISVALPFLEEAKTLGLRTMVECTPAYLGRDPALLKKISDATQIQFITNTGYYGASDNKYLPAHVYSENAGELADRWVDEWEKGINGTGIRPGFIKIGVNSSSLSPLHSKLVTAAAQTHLQTGLVIASHTGPALPAFEQIQLLEELGVAAAAFIWVHAQVEDKPEKHVQAARKGAWISLDGLNDDNLKAYLKMVKNLREQGLLHQVLLSHDAGWYSPGEDKGGTFRGYATLFKRFVPLLLSENFSEKDIEQLLVVNPKNAYKIKVRKRD